MSLHHMSDDELTDLLKTLRWGDPTQEVCAHCGSIDQHYARRRRRRTSRRPSSQYLEPANPTWQCKHCQGVFSITSGTLFDGTKLSLRTIVTAVVVVLGPGNGFAALALSVVLGLPYKSAFLLHHRIQEAMAADQPQTPFAGIVQMDGAYFCGKPRKPNRRMPRVTREQLQRRFGKASVPGDVEPWTAMGMTRKNYFKSFNKRTVLAITDSNGPPGSGSRAVVMAVSRGEREGPITRLARESVEPGSLFMTDEAGAYVVLDKWFEHASVSHAREFCNDEGVNDNHCEAVFSRLRRLEYGVYHGFRPINLHYYANQQAWRHTHRRLSKFEQIKRLLATALRMPPSSRLRGYYAGRGVRPEILID